MVNLPAGMFTATPVTPVEVRIDACWPPPSKVIDFVISTGPWRPIQRVDLTADHGLRDRPSPGLARCRPTARVGVVALAGEPRPRRLSRRRARPSQKHQREHNEELPHGPPPSSRDDSPDTTLARPRAGVYISGLGKIWPRTSKHDPAVLKPNRTQPLASPTQGARSDRCASLRLRDPPGSSWPVLAADHPRASASARP